MTTATRTRQTENSIIEISLTRSVNDKVNFSDGYNIKTGREVYENYDVKITLKNSGKTIKVSGKPGGFAFFALQDKYSGKYPDGAYARVGDAYVGRKLYDLAMAMIGELDADVCKTEEQTDIEAVTVRAEANAYTEAEPRHGENGYCRKCHSHCYGDCDS